MLTNKEKLKSPRRQSNFGGLKACMASGNLVYRHSANHGRDTSQSQVHSQQCTHLQISILRQIRRLW